MWVWLLRVFDEVCSSIFILRYFFDLNIYSGSVVLLLVLFCAIQQHVYRKLATPLANALLVKLFDHIVKILIVRQLATNTSNHRLLFGVILDLLVMRATIRVQHSLVAFAVWQITNTMITTLELVFISKLDTLAKELGLLVGIENGLCKR